MSTYIFMGYLLIWLGAIGIYLASPNQRWLSQPLPKWRARRIGMILMVSGVATLTQAMQVVAAIFASVISLMLAFILLPYLGVFRSARKGG